MSLIVATNQTPTMFSDGPDWDPVNFEQEAFSLDKFVTCNTGQQSLPLTPISQYHACSDALWLERPDPAYLSALILYVLQSHSAPCFPKVSIFIVSEMISPHSQNTYIVLVWHSLLSTHSPLISEPYIWLIPLVNQKFESKIAHIFSLSAFQLLG